MINGFCIREERKKKKIASFAWIVNQWVTLILFSHMPSDYWIMLELVAFLCRFMFDSSFFVYYSLIFSRRNLNTFFIVWFFGFLIQPINIHSEQRINIIDKIHRNHTVMTSPLIPLSMIFTYGSFFLLLLSIFIFAYWFQHEYNELICDLPFFGFCWTQR